MAETVAKNSSDGVELARTLDELLVRYLHLIDQYQTVQSRLTGELSSGYISLAQANRSTQHNIRYGQDYYDARMQAARIVNIKDEAGSTSRLTVTTLTDSNKSRWQLDELESPRVPSEDVLGSDELEVEEKEEASSSKVKPNDPLRWFGILLPPALRAAQGHFSRAVDSSIPELLHVVHEIELLEPEIQSTRTALKEQS